MQIMEFLNTQIVPAVLVLVMLGLGLSLTAADFRRVVAFPLAAGVGLSAQMVGLPLVAFALAYLLAPTPAIAVGAIIVAACPSGVTSNAYSFAARADVALSVTLSAVTSVITVLTIPLLTYLALQLFFEEGDVPALPVGQMLWTLVRVTMLPVLVGMAVRGLAPRLATRAVEPLRRVTLVLVIFVLLAAALSSYNVILENFASAGLLVVAMNVLTMALGYGLGRLFRLPTAQVVTITFEVGVQNLALALLMTLTLFGNPDLAIAALLYAVVMPATALAFVSIGRRLIEAA